MGFPRRRLLRILSFAFGSSFIPGRTELSIAGQTALPPTTSTSPTGAAAGQRPTGKTETEKVTGIGGLFFRAHDPATLGQWYQQHLGISMLRERQQ
jgi:hypothetical protein